MPVYLKSIRKVCRSIAILSALSLSWTVAYSASGSPVDSTTQSDPILSASLPLTTHSAPAPTESTELYQPFDLSPTSASALGAPAPVRLDFDRPLFADDSDSVINQIHLSLTGQFLWGPVAGYTQIAAGAKKKTTSHQRPRLSQLGIDHATIPDLELAATYGPHQFFVGAQIIRMDDRAKLDGTIVTHGLGLAVKSKVKDDIQLDWYRFGYRYPIPMFEADNGVATLTITPQINAAFWDFYYRITSAKLRTTRRFSKFTGQLGVDVDWRPEGGPFSIGVMGLASPPLDAFPFIVEGEVVARYRLVESKAYSLTGSLGVAAERIDYHDTRLRANHIRADFGPMLIAGAQLSF